LAEAAYREILSDDPNFAPAIQMLGVLAHQSGRNDEAIALFRRMIELEPDNADAHNNLGVALAAQWKLEEAAEAYRRAVLLRPGFAEAHNNLGSVLRDLGRLNEAIDSYRNAIALRADYFEALQNLGLALQQSDRLGEALAAFQTAVKLKPDDVRLLYNLGIAYNDAGDLDRAILCHRRALSFQPGSFDTLSGMARALKDAGMIDESLACYRRALSIQPDAPTASRMLFTMHYKADIEPGLILEEHRKWNDTYAKPLAAEIRPHENDRDSQRRLRVGYVSADFHDHPVGRCLLPILRDHHREHFEVFCYAGGCQPDKVTAQMRRHADGWCDMSSLSDEQLARRVREDRIDILVDLAVHTAGNRLLAFARKPAPVQVTWLGWPGTSGLDAMDYRLSDPYLDPPGENDAFYTEKTIRLPDSFWCYAPIEADVPAGELPAFKNGHITFGCLNNFWKMNDRVVDIWASLMSVTPGSRLLLRTPQGGPRQRWIEKFRSRGVDPIRLEFGDRAPRQDYWKLYHRIDISLDTTPYGGHTTAMDSLWMGVPVVSLAGRLPVGRAGVTISSNIGLPELATHSPEEYVRVAARLAGDLPRLAELRKALRGQIAGSPLMDGAKFTLGLEQAFRSMWESWCAAGS
jgi:predicted O-linked N-acetylglucosamine transferase (SPINDLY family)